MKTIITAILLVLAALFGYGFYCGATDSMPRVLVNKMGVDRMNVISQIGYNLAIGFRMEK